MPDARVPAKTTMIFDGECGFCRRWIARWKSWTGASVNFVPYQELKSTSLKREDLERAVHLIEADGQVFRGAEAVFRMLSPVPGKRWLSWAYERVPLFARASEWFYSFVARHRVAFSKVSYWLWGKSVEPPRYFLVRRVFLAGLGATYLVAFVSFWSQLKGLIGSNGVLPAANFLSAVESHYGPERLRLLPTLAWISDSDAALHLICAAGVAFSILLMASVAPALSVAMLWALYLSLCSIAREFLGYQWDILLLEVGFVAIFLAPWRLWPKLGRETAVSGWALFLANWLLFKLMFSSGVVKLASGDEAWRNLTGLGYHYETQPLPTPIAWYMHQLPAWAHKAETAAMFLIELALPFLIFLPKRPRMIAFFGTVSLQALIGFTGNYTFFNLLTVLLALLLLEDSQLAKVLPRRWSKLAARNPNVAPEAIPKRALTGVFAIFALVIGGSQVLSIAVRGYNAPALIDKAQRAVAPFRTINSYGLFAVMTTVRNEITIEGSRDGNEWKAYEFKWKPGELDKRPRFVAPHQPRLDWQMWFAALGTFPQNFWLQSFMAHLLNGTPDVLALLAENPFAGAPPQYLRAKIHRYRFTNSEERAATGNWWKRDQEDDYSPVLTRRAK